MQFINGDKFLFLGTRKECAEYFNVSVETVTFWGTPSNLKRIENRGKGKKKGGNGKMAIRMED